MRVKLSYFIALSLIFGACSQQKTHLSHYGEPRAVSGTDTSYYRIPNFEFIDQDSNRISPKSLEGQIYVADFFFTTCPSICPMMKKEMLRVYEAYEHHPTVSILSHSIDPEYDSVPVLKEYSDALGISSDKWHMVTGGKDSILAMARHYLTVATEDAEAPGGYFHSDVFVLVDKSRHIRGFYHGTDPADVDRLLEEIPVLLKEYETEKP